MSISFGKKGAGEKIINANPITVNTETSQIPLRVQDNNYLSAQSFAVIMG